MSVLGWVAGIVFILFIGLIYIINKANQDDYKQGLVGNLVEGFKNCCKRFLGGR